MFVKDFESISIFYNVKANKTMIALTDALAAPKSEKAKKYYYFFHLLAENGYENDFAGFIYDLVRYDDNAFTQAAAAGKTISPILKAQIVKELDIFSKLASCKAEDAFGLEVTPWGSKKRYNFSYRSIYLSIKKLGHSIWGKYNMFEYDDGEIRPIKNPLRASVEDIIGYNTQKELLISNTRKFYQGLKANNVLLAGDRGSGKSTAVNAVFNMFSDKLKLIELPLNKISEITKIIQKASTLPYRFIIFIDDLVADKDSPEFYPLKAALEGSLLGKSPNILIYATSNRRHLVKESFSDREDEVHKTDGMQDRLALVDRFGLIIYYENLKKEDYLQLVSELADKQGINYDKEELLKGAERWALEKSVRSPRGAVQYLNSLKDTNN